MSEELNIIPIKWVQERNGDKAFPVTHITAVLDNSGNTLQQILNSMDSSSMKLGTVVGRMHRTNVSGSGNLTITGTTGYIPITPVAGTYVVAIYMISTTQSYRLTVTYGTNTYSLNAANGVISDARSLTVAADAHWSATLGSTSVNPNTEIIVVIYEGTTANVSTFGHVAVTNHYNDLDGTPTNLSDFTNDIGNATSAGTGLMTAADKIKLDGIETGAEVNQKAYGIIGINAKDFTAGTKTDKFTFSAGTNVTLTTGASKVVISSTDTKPGKLTTTATTSQTTASNEDLGGTINLHKISKTGKYEDLVNRPTSLSAFTNDVGFITSGISNLSNYATSANVVTALSKKPDVAFKTINANTTAVTASSSADTVTLTGSTYISLAATGTGTTKKIQISATGLVPTGRTVNGKNLSSNITLNASDVGALSASTKYAASIDLTKNNTTFQYTWQLKDQDGNNIGSSQTLDLPIESVVVGGKYIASAKTVQLTLQSGSTIEFSIADLISGLQNEITSTNKLSADLIKDGTSNKVYTAAEKTKLSGIASGAEVNVQSDWSVTATTNDAYIKNKPTIGNGALSITTATTGMALGNFSANQTTNTTVTLHKVAATGVYGDLSGRPTIPTVNNGVLTIQRNSTTLGSFSANQTGVVTVNVSVPTNVTELTNHITSASVVNAINSLTGSYVTLNTVQTITARKTMASGITINNPSSAIVSDITYTTSGSTCHQQYDGVNNCLKFIFD